MNIIYEKTSSIVEKLKVYFLPMSDFTTCYINILKAMVGTALIYFPITIYTFGVIPTLIGIIISICFSVGGFYIYIISNHLSGPSTINALCRRVNHYFYLFANLMLILMMLLAGVGYTKLIEETYIKIFEYFNRKLDHAKILMTGHILLFSIPISCLKHMSHLRFTSFIGVVAILYIVFLSVSRFVINFGKHTFTPHLFTTKSTSSILLRLPFFVFSFTAHQAILPLQNEFFGRSPNFFLKVVLAATVTAGFIYALLGITMNYLYDFSLYTLNDSCLVALPNDGYGLFARVSYLLLLTFSVPLQLIPLRIILVEAFKGYIEKNATIERLIGFILPIILNIIISIIYYSEVEQKLVQDISGGIANTSNCLIFPAAIFLLGINEYLKKTRYTSSFYKYLSIGLLLAGVLVFSTFVAGYFNK